MVLAKTGCKVSASVLSADFSNLSSAVASVEPYVDEFHLDVMDGHFVPNISFGPDVVKIIRGMTRKPLDVHLMVEEPMKHIDSFVDAGADMITFHYETDDYLRGKGKLQSYIKSKGVKVGIAYSPDTPAYILDSDVDRILLMSVYPGFAGQKFIRSTLKKISEVKEFISRNSYDIEIAVDGGINDVTAYKVARRGVDIVVAGSYIFNGDPEKNVLSLRGSLLEGVLKKKRL